MQPGCHVGQYSRDTLVVLWGWLGWCGKVDDYLEWEPDVRALVCAKGEWSDNYSWKFYGIGLEEGQDVVTIVCNGGQRLGGGLLHINWLRFHVLSLNGDDAIVVVGLICLTWSKTDRKSVVLQVILTWSKTDRKSVVLQVMI